LLVAGRGSPLRSQSAQDAKESSGGQSHVVNSRVDVGKPVNIRREQISIVEAIRLDEARLAQLDEERQVVSDRLRQLRTQLSTLEAAATTSVESSALSANEKIPLFCSLFKGREDVFPKLWICRKGDRKGYMPACANDGIYTLCGKRIFPRIKCGHCDHQAYIPVSDNMIREHLQGKQTIGIYPLLPDDPCRLLAVDFDKAGWQEDVAAFWETCSFLGIPVAVERSRSGNGAHA
jgi:hypothetical protein